jgi:hypothetical protein
MSCPLKALKQNPSRGKRDGLNSLVPIPTKGKELMSAQYQKPPRPRNRRPVPPLLDLDGGHVRARRWVVRRFGFSSAMAGAVAAAAGLGCGR